MTESTMNRDEWLAEIKLGVQDQGGGGEDDWTEFLENAAWWLHENDRSNTDTIRAAVGLVKSGIRKASDIDLGTNTKQEFRDALTPLGVPGLICDMLYEKDWTGRRISEKIFSLEHLRGIVADGTWVDCGKNFEFKGRDAFLAAVKRSLGRNLQSPPTSSVVPPPSTSSSNIEPQSDIKVSTALVYSSVSGTGKTVSMLQLKSSVKEVNGIKVIVAYLGFNTGLHVNKVEKEHIKQNGTEGAAEVLCRRLAAATIISDCNPDVVMQLPEYSTVYKGIEIPSVDTSKELLLRHTGATKNTPICIVAGVDEFQLVNMELLVQVESAQSLEQASKSIGLGRLFLRILRRWQHEWHKNGIQLLPLGTGIAIDWSADPTTGLNIPLHGEDTTLISKNDFKKLAAKVVQGLGDDEFHKRFSSGTTKETVVDLITASYWPRVRLLEWWRDNKTEALTQQYGDSNAVQWPNWLCRWLRNESFSCVDDTAAVPGKGDSDGKIHCLFELSQNSQNFSVIPDGYSSHSLIQNLGQELPIPHLYRGLDII